MHREKKMEVDDDEKQKRWVILPLISILSSSNPRLEEDHGTDFAKRSHRSAETETTDECKVSIDIAHHHAQLKLHVITSFHLLLSVVRFRYE